VTYCACCRPAGRAPPCRCICRPMGVAGVGTGVSAGCWAASPARWDHPNVLDPRKPRGRGAVALAQPMPAGPLAALTIAWFGVEWLKRACFRRPCWPWPPRQAGCLPAGNLHRSLLPRLRSCPASGPVLFDLAFDPATGLWANHRRRPCWSGLLEQAGSLAAGRACHPTIRGLAARPGG